MYLTVTGPFFKLFNLSTMSSTQAPKTITAKMAQEIISDLQDELPTGVTVAEIMEPFYQMHVIAVGSAGFIEMFPDELNQEGLSMAMTMLTRIFKVMAPIIPQEV
jgi:hypothetical protein